MHCDGKCYLHKQLSKESKQDNDSSDGVKVKIESVAFLLQETTEHFSAFINYAPPQYEQYIASLLRGTGNSVFHPPLA